MSERCQGCGALLQHDRPREAGYTPKAGSVLCQRCFRLTHYDDLQFSMREGIDPDRILAQIHAMDALILWVVDLFDFEASLLEGMNRHLFGKDVIVVGTKRDLLPETVGSEKLAKFVYGRLKELGIQVKGLVVTGKNIPGGPEEVLRAIEWAKGKDVVVMGMANAGKSTLLNALMDKPQLTSSRYPGTTLDFNPLDIHGVTVYDTPGLTPRNSMLLHLDEEDLKTVLPAKAVKPVGFQLRGDQSFAVGGLCRIDLLGCEHVSAVFYCSNLLELHRGRADKADELWQRHYGELLRPIPAGMPYAEWTSTVLTPLGVKEDIVIPGVGWMSLSGTCGQIRVTHPQTLEIKHRKAMI